MNTPASLRSELIAIRSESLIDIAGIASVSPYVHEHVEMVNSIVGDGPYINRAMAVAESTMTAIMAREAAYAGIEVTWDMIMESKLDLMPKRFDLEAEVDIPPLPRPGEYKFT